MSHHIRREKYPEFFRKITRSSMIKPPSFLSGNHQIFYEKITSHSVRRSQLYGFHSQLGIIRIVSVKCGETIELPVENEHYQEIRTPYINYRLALNEKSINKAQIFSDLIFIFHWFCRARESIPTTNAYIASKAAVYYAPKRGRWSPSFDLQISCSLNKCSGSSANPSRHLIYNISESYFNRSSYLYHTSSHFPSRIRTGSFLDIETNSSIFYFWFHSHKSSCSSGKEIRSISSKFYSCCCYTGKYEKYTIYKFFSFEKKLFCVTNVFISWMCTFSFKYFTEFKIYIFFFVPNVDKLNIFHLKQIVAKINFAYFFHLNTHFKNVYRASDTLQSPCYTKNALLLLHNIFMRQKLWKGILKTFCMS